MGFFSWVSVTLFFLLLSFFSFFFSAVAAAVAFGWFREVNNYYYYTVYSCVVASILLLQLIMVSCCAHRSIWFLVFWFFGLCNSARLGVKKIDKKIFHRIRSAHSNKVEHSCEGNRKRFPSLGE